MSNDYTGNAAKLLSLGEIGAFGEWRDYLKLGLTADDVPELLRMIDDAALYDLDLTGAEGWAPIHAWRALGQLRAAEAAEPLTKLLNRIETDDDDYAIEDIPIALAMIGAPAIAPLTIMIGDRDAPESVRTSAISALAGAVKTDDEHRTDVIHFLAEVLDRHEPERVVNAYLVEALVDLRAVEMASSMEAAFDANVVALTCWAIGKRFRLCSGCWTSVSRRSRVAGCAQRRLPPADSIVTTILHGPTWLMTRGIRQRSPRSRHAGARRARPKKRRENSNAPRRRKSGSSRGYAGRRGRATGAVTVLMSNSTSVCTWTGPRCSTPSLRIRARRPPRPLSNCQAPAPSAASIHAQGAQ